MPFVQPMVAALGLVCEVKNSNSRGWVLQRADAFPATGIGSQQTEIIDRDLSRESSVAFVAISVPRDPRVALGQRLNRHRVEVSHARIDHPSVLGIAKVFCCLGERGQMPLALLLATKATPRSWMERSKHLGGHGRQKRSWT